MQPRSLPHSPLLCHYLDNTVKSSSLPENGLRCAIQNICYRISSPSSSSTTADSRMVDYSINCDTDSDTSKSVGTPLQGKMVHAKLFEQLIPSPYVDRRRLLYKLRSRFPGVDQNGNNKFKVQVHKCKLLGYCQCRNETDSL